MSHKSPLLFGGICPRSSRGGALCLPKRGSACVVLLGLCTISILFYYIILLDSQTFEDVRGKILQQWSNNEELTKEIQKVLAKQRRLIADEMKGYNFKNIKVSNLSDLVPENGGRPIRSLVFTTWRSGSTFIGDVLNSHPGNWYHYEPLIDLHSVQIRGPPFSNPYLNHVKRLLNCNYSDAGHHLDYWKKYKFVIKRNKRLFPHCTAHPDLCLKPEFLSAMCQLFPFQSTKIVRLRIKLAEQLLITNSKLNVKILLLVRDPRGTMQSRKRREWCRGHPECIEPALLCADLTANYHDAVILAQKHPKKFRVVRYEDLSLEPYRVTEELFQFFNLNFHPDVKLFLDTHTNKNIGGAQSTTRDSKTVPFHWKNDLDFPEVQEIQSVCKKAMKLWGYLPAQNASHLRNFNPIAEYSLK